jgi:hypothetical protein
MLLKIVALFLVGMIVLGALRTWGAKLGLPGAGRRQSALDRLRCPTCRRIQISDQPGPCGRPDCEYR